MVLSFIMIKPFKPQPNVDGMKPIGQAMPQYTAVAMTQAQPSAPENAQPVTMEDHKSMKELDDVRYNKLENIKNALNTISETSNANNSIEGVTSTWTGLDLSTKPNFTITSPGGSFQFTESYSGPGLKTQTIIQRTTQIESVTSTTSQFSN